MSSSPIPSPDPHRVRGIVLAGLAAAVLPTAAAALLLWLTPAGCDVRGAPATYFWACLMPGVMITVSWPLALLLTLASFFQRGNGWRSPKGAFALVMGSGVLTHVAVVVVYFFILDLAAGGEGVEELLWLPQPFCAGAIGGAVFWIARRQGGKRWRRHAA